MASIYNGSIILFYFFKLSVLLLNLYLSFLLLLKFLFMIKWGVGMRFKVLKYYDMQENGTIEMVSFSPFPPSLRYCIVILVFLQ